MFNLGMNIQFHVDKIQYPVKFSKGNVCVHCGSENTLKCVDIFGNQTNEGNEIYPFEHIVCTKCKRVYSIEWRQDENEPGKLNPIPVDPSIKQQFLNSLALDKENRVKIIE